MEAYNASFGLHAYKQWRKNIQPMKIGTILKFVKGYTGITKSTSIKENSFFKVVKKLPAICAPDKISEEQGSYMLIQCTMSGKDFKKSTSWHLEGLRRGIACGEIEIISEPT